MTSRTFGTNIMDYIDHNEFSNFLNTTKGEREIAQFFKDRPEILYFTMCPTGGHSQYVFSEFPLGSEYKCDFVTLMSYSGAWQVNFIELEPVDDKIYTKAGVPTKRLAGGLKQLEDWSDYIENNILQVRNDLVRYCKNFDLLGFEKRGQEPCNFSGDRLAEPNTYLQKNYTLIIGRSTSLGVSARKRKAMHRTRHFVDILTYDRITNCIGMRFANKEYWENKNT